MNLSKLFPSTFLIGACLFVSWLVFYTLNLTQLAPLFFSDEEQVKLAGDDGSFLGPIQSKSQMPCDR